MSTRRQRHSVLLKRIARQPRHHGDHAVTHLVPVAADSPMPSGHPPPPQVMTMPLTLVEVTADGVTVREAQPLYAGPRGAPVPATGPGHWVQLYAAGRP